jgi:hypothetical protein
MPLYKIKEEGSIRMIQPFGRCRSLEKCGQESKAGNIYISLNRNGKVMGENGMKHREEKRGK